MQPKTNNTPTEAQVTAQTQASGLPPGDMGKQKTEADANGQQGGQVTKTVREAKRVTIPADFDFEVDPEPRPPMDPMNPPAPTQGQNPQSPNPIDAMANGIEIEFRGQKQQISLEDAKTMIQQFKSISGMSPVVGLANEVASKLGIKDPREVAALMQQALMAHMQKQMGDQGQGQQPPATADQQRQATGAPEMPVTPTVTPEVRAAVKDFFETNGLTPTPEVEQSMLAMVAYGKHIEQMAAAFPQIAADVKMFKDAQQTHAQRALQDAIGARAAKVAAELGIDTQEEVAGFQEWAKGTEKQFPGFVNNIRTNPDAMETAIRTYHTLNEGRRALEAKKGLETKVNQDLSRAGGDAPTGRGGTGAPAPQNDQKAFEADLMSRM